MLGAETGLVFRGLVSAGEPVAISPLPATAYTLVDLGRDLKRFDLPVAFDFKIDRSIRVGQYDGHFQIEELLDRRRERSRELVG